MPLIERLLGFLLAVGSEQRKLMYRFGRELIAVFFQCFLGPDLRHPRSDRDLTSGGEIKNREPQFLGDPQLVVGDSSDDSFFWRAPTPLITALAKSIEAFAEIAGKPSPQM